MSRIDFVFKDKLQIDNENKQPDIGDAQETRNRQSMSDNSKYP